jgi:ABC-type nitrate/sulfonate/bicarbonate transport system substrate-binding protein
MRYGSSNAFPSPRGTTGRRRGLRALALAAAAVLSSTMVTACFASADSAGSGGSDTVTVGLGGNIFDVPVNLADAQGYFKKEGLTVKYVTLTSATGVSTLQSGSVQFLTASPTDMETAVSKQLPLTAVSAIGLGNPLGLIVSKKFASAHGITSATTAAQAVKTLSGSTAGYSSANTKAEAGIYLKAYGINPSTVNWVELPSPSADETALNTNQIDWFITSEPIPLELQHSGNGIVVANPLNVPQWSAAASGYGLFTLVQQSYATQNPSAVKKFVTAVQEATAYMNEHGANSAVLSAAEKTLPGVPDPVLKASLAQVVWPKNGAMSQSTWNKTLAFLNSLGTDSGGAKITSGNWTNKYLP